MKKKNAAGTNFRRIFNYFLFTIISAFVFSLITNTYYINHIQNETQAEYVEKLESLSMTLQTSFDEINQNTALLSISDNVNKIVRDRQYIRPKEYAAILDTVEALRQMSVTKTYILNAFTVHNPNKLVIGSNGTSTIDEFFRYLSAYDNYNQGFWENLGSGTTILEKYIVLKPSTITNTSNGATQQVIPTIQYATNDTAFNFPLVINISKSYIDSLLTENQLTPGSLLYIYDKRDAIIADSQRQTEFDLKAHHLKEIGASAEVSDSYLTTVSGTRYMIVTNTNGHSNYVFIAVVPYSDFISESMSVLMVPMLLLFGGVIIVTMISFVLSRRIYNPIQRIISDNQRLRDDLTLAIPYVCERYLMSILNNNEIMKEEDVKEFLAGYDFSFPGSHFMVIQTVMNFNEAYFLKHTRAEYNAICQGGLAIATEAFKNLSHSYVFSVGINQICVILNFNKSVLKADIMASIQDYHKAVDSQEEQMTVHSGIGRLYEGYEGMQKSYQESLNASSQITYMSQSMIRTYSKADDAFTNSHYAIEEENRLVNYLLQGDREKVIDQLTSILDKNMDSKIGIHALRELYLQLYNTSVRVMNTREISIYDIMGEDYLDISTHMGDLAPDQLHDYIVLLFERVIESSSQTNEKYDIANLKEYLEAHYCDEIYLDAIAENFGKSPKYMSKFIKKTLGTTFQDYISALRINKAKELLLETGDSVNAIAEAVGFNSRHPFIRKFKILEGVTPTEYRKLHK